MSEFELSELSDEEIESMSVDGLGLYILVHLSKDINFTRRWTGERRNLFEKV